MNIEFILQIISCFVIFIAIIEIYYTRKSGHSQLIMDLYDKWDSDSLIESRNLIQNLCNSRDNKLDVNKMAQLNKKEYLIALGVFNFFDILGYFVKTNSLTVKDVKVFMGEGIVYYYEDVFEDYITQRRKHKEDFYKNFEYLRDKCKEKTNVEILKDYINIHTMKIVDKHVF